MGYIKAFITRQEIHGFSDAGYRKETKVLEGGFNSANVISIEENGPDSAAILLQENISGGEYANRGVRRKVVVNLPVDKVNALFEHIEIEGGVLDLLAHTKPENPASAETPVPHRNSRGQMLSIDFNNMAEPGSRAKKPLIPPTSGPADKKPFRPFGGL